MTSVHAAEGAGVAVASRPPTVTISAENVLHLQTFPRPPKDNGIGLHFHLDLSDQHIAESVQHLQEIRAKWTLIYAQDELQIERAARACFAAGIMPVARIGRKIDEFMDAVPFVKGLRRAWQSAGWGGPVEPLYVQLMNEPDNEREWMIGKAPPDYPQRFGNRWADEAPKIVGEGAFVGIQVLYREGFDRAVDAISARHEEDIWKRAFFSQHNYGENHPPAYPYDPLKQQTDPGKTIIEDDTAALRFLAHAAWMKERIGFVLPVVGGEGGWLLGNEVDRKYPKVEFPLHAQYHREMYEWFRTGVLSNGEALPDYLFSITSWIDSSFDFGAQNWWGNILSPTGRLDATIEAVKSIPEFVRRFSWDGPNPNPDPGTGQNPDTGTGQNPDTGTGQNPPPTTLEWDARLDTLGVRLEPAGEDARWRLVKAEFWDEQKSDGKHHIFVKALRADGQPAAGVPFIADWPDRHPNDLPVLGTTDANGDTNLPMFINFDPTLKNGKMFATVEGMKADVVRGMGLPFNHHVSFVLTYKEV